MYDPKRLNHYPTKRKQIIISQKSHHYKKWLQIDSGLVDSLYIYHIIQPN